MAEAYASLGLLKHVPCPAGDKCTAFKCLFRHTWDEAAWPLPQGDKAGLAPVLSHPGQGATTSSVPAQEPPQKKLKVVEASRNGNTHNNNKTSGEGPTATDSSTNPTKKDDLYDPLSAPIYIPNSRQSVSPPPLKRKEPTLRFSSASAPASKTTTKIATSGTPNSSTATPEKPSPTPGTPQPSKSEPKKVPRKPESLNPRLLKKSPAGHEVRFKLLKLLHAEYSRLNSELKKDANDEESKLVLSDQALIWLALDEEQKIAIEKPSIYTNVIKNRIMSYKRMPVSKWKDERSETRKAAAKAGPQKKEPPMDIETGLTPEQEVEILPRLLTPIKDLANFNYVPVIPSDADVKKAQEGVEMSKGWEVCDRCQKRFQVFPGRREEDGKLTSGGSCTHHPGKTYFPDRTFGDTSRQPKRYRCCAQSVGDSAGCTTIESHVFKTKDPKRLAAVLQFEETPSNTLAPKDRAVCFDCEMCYTVQGLELIRLTATSWPTGEELLDVLVQPIGEILDLNSQYSGVWQQDLVNAVPWTAQSKPTQVPGQRKRLQMVSSPVVARDLLFSLISPETPLIGHGLENDLNSVRIVHPTLIDTILLYPHKRGGLPLRNGLKMLMETKLNRHIQMEPQPGQLSGHDSAEDARAAGDLVRLKVKSEWLKMKDLGWTFANGKLVPPGGHGKGKAKDGALTEDFLEEDLISFN